MVCRSSAFYLKSFMVYRPADLLGYLPASQHWAGTTRGGSAGAVATVRMKQERGHEFLVRLCVTWDRSSLIQSQRPGY